tara:strand:+ start:3957 stop:4949 length:993 start_codon:yes stop_codon:yes gene_type:complete
MATWKKVLTEADKATDAASGVANGESGLVTGNAVFDYIVAQNFGSGSGDITNVTVTADDSNTVGAATGDASFTVAGGTNVTTSASGSTLTVNATAVHLASANQTLSNNRTVDQDNNDLTIDPKGGTFAVSDSSGSPSAAEIQVGSGTLSLMGLTFPGSDGSNGQFIKTNGSGTLSFGTAANDNVSKANLTTVLASYTGSDTLNIGDADDDTTVVIRGNLQVDGTTTTINSTSLTVDDKIILCADGSTTEANTGTGGLEIEVGNSTQNPFVGFVDGAALTQMVVKAAGATTSFPIAVMEFSSNSTAPSGDAGGVGSFHFDTGDDKLYIRTA